MKPKVNSTEYKIQQKKKYLQRLIDIPYEEWTDYDHWYNDNKPFYIGKKIIVDIIEDQVVVGEVVD